MLGRGDSCKSQKNQCKLVISKPEGWQEDEPPRPQLISVLSILHIYVLEDFFPLEKFNLDGCITNNFRMSALRQIIPSSPVLHAVGRRAVSSDNISFNFFSDTRLYVMGLVLEPRQQDSGLIRILIELNLKSGVISFKAL